MAQSFRLEMIEVDCVVLILRTTSASFLTSRRIVGAGSAPIRFIYDPRLNHRGRCGPDGRDHFLASGNCATSSSDIVSSSSWKCGRRNATAL
jgi:hypothetical protein